MLRGLHVPKMQRKHETDRLGVTRPRPSLRAREWPSCDERAPVAAPDRGTHRTALVVAPGFFDPGVCSTEAMLRRAPKRCVVGPIGRCDAVLRSGRAY